MVNQIENNIKQSCDYVEKAKDNVEKAVQYQQKARKVQCGSTHEVDTLTHWKTFSGRRGSVPTELQKHQ